MPSKYQKTPKEFLQDLYPESPVPGRPAHVSSQKILEALLEWDSWQDETQAIGEAELIKRINDATKEPKLTRNKLISRIRKINDDLWVRFGADPPVPLYISRCTLRKKGRKRFTVLAVFNELAATRAHNRFSAIERMNAAAKNAKPKEKKPFNGVQIPNAINRTIAETLAESTSELERQLSLQLYGELPASGTCEVEDEGTGVSPGTGSPSPDVSGGLEFFCTSWVLKFKIEYCLVTDNTGPQYKAWEAIQRFMAPICAYDKDSKPVQIGPEFTWSEQDSEYMTPQEAEGELVFIPRFTDGEYKVECIGYYTEEYMRDKLKVSHTWSLHASQTLGTSYPKVMEINSLPLTVEQRGADTKIHLMAEFPLANTTHGPESDVKISFNIGKTAPNYVHIASAKILSKSKIAKMF